MNVLNVTGGISANAAEQTANRLKRYFDGCEVTCGVFESANPEFDRIAANNDIHTRYFGPSVTDWFEEVSLLPGKGYPRAAVHAARTRNEFDLVHVYGGPLFHGPVGAMHAAVSGTPLITRFNGYVPLPKSQPKRLVVRTVVRQLLDSTRVVFNSRAQRDDVLDTYDVDDADHITVVPPGINERFYYPVGETTDLAEELGIGDETRVIGSVMTPRPVKRLDRAFEVLADLRERFDIEYVVVGDSSHISKYREQAREIGVGDAVHWAGYRDQEELAKWYSLFEVTILTSEWESFGMSLTESALCETPGVAFDVGGMRDQIISGRTGYLVEPYDTAAFAERIAALLDDSEMRAVFGEHGREYVAERYTLDRVSEQYGQLVDSLI